MINETNQIMEILNNVYLKAFIGAHIRVIIPYITTRKITQAITINKTINPKNIKKVHLPPELKLKYDEIKIEPNTYKSYKRYINDFLTVLTENFDSNQLILLKNNLNEMRIKNYSFFDRVFRPDTIGLYDAKNNIISLKEDEFLVQSAIYHELVHLATAKSGKTINYCGFSQQFKDYTFIGRGLNEGYTQLFCERYFGDIKGVSGAYPLFVDVAKQIEKIVGKKKMEKLFLSANLKGLIRELKKYSSEEEIGSFISSLDILKDSKRLGVNKRARLKHYKTVYTFVAKTSAIKLKKQFECGTIKIDELEDNIAYIFRYYNIFRYYIDIDVIDILHKVFNNPELISNSLKGPISL